jgi:hypothetical protein
MRRCVVGFESNRFSVSLYRLIYPALLEIGASEVIMGFRVLWFEPYGLFIPLYRLIYPAVVEKRERST